MEKNAQKSLKFGGVANFGVNRQRKNSFCGGQIFDKPLLVDVVDRNPVFQARTENRQQEQR